MRNEVLTACAAAAFGAVACAPLVSAQPESSAEQRREAELEREEQQRTAELERREREREAAQRERESLQEQLERAREDMERAAREVARLSADFAAPYIEMGKNQFWFGGTAQLGINPEDTELGVRVAGVSPNGPAAAAGVAIGDVITEIDGAALADPRPTGRGRRSPSQLLVAQMRNVEPGEAVKLTVVRDGDEREVEVQTRERSEFVFLDAPRNVPRVPNPPNASRVAPFWRPFMNDAPWRDMELVTLTPGLGSYFGTEKGILVVRGPQDDAFGLRDGDVILDIGGREPTSPEHAIRILASFEQGETLKVNIMRSQRRQALEIKIPASSDSNAD